MLALELGERVALGEACRRARFQNAFELSGGGGSDGGCGAAGVAGRFVCGKLGETQLLGGGLRSSVVIVASAWIPGCPGQAARGGRISGKAVGEWAASRAPGAPRRLRRRRCLKDSLCRYRQHRCCVATGRGVPVVAGGSRPVLSLPKGVEDEGKAELGAKPLGVGGKGTQGLRGSPEEQPQQDATVGEDDRAQGRGEREDDVEFSCGAFRAHDTRKPSPGLKSHVFS